MSSATAPATTNVYSPTGSAVQVNVQGGGVSNSLGIASIILGGMSFLVCWMPLIGFGLSGLGLLLGIGGIVLAVARRGTGIGFAIAGTAVSFAGIALGVFFIVAMHEMTRSLQEATDRISRDVGATPVLPSQNSGHANDRAPIEYPDARLPIQLGAVQISIYAVTVGKVPLVRSFLNEETESADELLTVWLTLSNTSSNKKIDYQSWMSDFASLRGIHAELTDDTNNRYRLVAFGATASVKSTTDDNSIYPGKSIVDAVVFEPPVNSAKYLNLRLSGKGCGESGEFRFRIPVEMIRR